MHSAPQKRSTPHGRLALRAQAEMLAAMKQGDDRLAAIYRQLLQEHLDRHIQALRVERCRLP